MQAEAFVQSLSKFMGLRAMRLLQLIGVLLFVPGALAFFWFLNRGTDSPLVYLTAVSMYLGLALALYATVILWVDD